MKPKKHAKPIGLIIFSLGTASKLIKIQASKNNAKSYILLSLIFCLRHFFMLKLHKHVYFCKD